MKPGQSTPETLTYGWYADLVTDNKVPYLPHAKRTEPRIENTDQRLIISVGGCRTIDWDQVYAET